MATNAQSSGEQPPMMGSMGPAQSYNPPMSMQFPPVAPPQQGQSFIPAPSQQFWPGGQVMPMPSAQNQQHQFSQSMQLLPLARPGWPGQGPSLSQAPPMPYAQPNRTIEAESPQPQQNAQSSNNHMPGVGGMEMPFSSSYTFSPFVFGLQQNGITASSRYRWLSQMPGTMIPTGGQPWVSSGGFIPVQQAIQQLPVTAATITLTGGLPNSTTSLGWQEKICYYNKKTAQITWEKPRELMTPIERADESTVWKEFTTPKGKKYYHNKVTKKSQWTIPDEVKLAREQAKQMASQGTQSEAGMASQALAANVSSVETTSTASICGVSSSPATVTLGGAVVSTLPVSGSPSIPAGSSVVTTNLAGLNCPVETITPVSMAVSGNAAVPSALVATTTAISSSESTSSRDVTHSADGASIQYLEKAKKGMPSARKINISPLEEKLVDDEPLLYASKQDAKNAVNSLMESANVESNWGWGHAVCLLIVLFIFFLGEFLMSRYQ